MFTLQLALFKGNNSASWVTRNSFIVRSDELTDRWNAYSHTRRSTIPNYLAISLQQLNPWYMIQCQSYKFWFLETVIQKWHNKRSAANPLLWVFGVSFLATNEVMFWFHTTSVLIYVSGVFAIPLIQED